MDEPTPGAQRKGCLILIAAMLLVALLYVCAVKAGA